MAGGVLTVSELGLDIDCFLFSAQAAHRYQIQLDIVSDWPGGWIDIDSLAPDCLTELNLPASDWNNDKLVNSADIILPRALSDIDGYPNPRANFNHDGLTTSADITAFLAAFFAELAGGCRP
ncbi:MAG: hypothetical protein H7Y88_05505 [Phycisphaerales bacterium]|nr:hypothetical protein [Phycisphaerales bacterium]